jgi:uncharacterized phage protein (TIGR01671 family)
MRTIKFRAWNTDENRMEYNSGIFSFMGVVHVLEDYLDPSPYHKTRIAKQFNGVTMQFTGLIDKNGKEIWEGDLLRVQSQYETDEPIDSAPNKVYFRDGAFRCGFHDMILGEKVCTGSEGNWNTEVLGNIYENPELRSVSDGESVAKSIN